MYSVQPVASAMIRIAICDDSPQCLEDTTASVRRYCSQRTGMEMSIHSFPSGFALLDAVTRRGGFDIYILDVLMPHINGIEVGASLRKADKDAGIILLTSSREFGVESYQIHANDYVLKPLEDAALFASLDRLIGKLDIKEENHFLISIMGGVYSVYMFQILFVEYKNHRLYVYTTDGDTIESSTMRQSFTTMVAPLLQDERFVQVAAGYVINMQHVRKATNQGFTLEGGYMVPLSRGYTSARGAYIEYVMKKTEM